MNKLMTSHGAIQYAVTGHGSAVIFLHSALVDHRQWDAQVEALSREHCCITYDLLGYGSSDNAPEEYDPADTLFALLDHLSVAKATLVGSSLGGSVAIHTAVRQPDRIQSLVLAGTGLFGFQPQFDEAEPFIYAEYEVALADHNVRKFIDLAEALWLVGIDGNTGQVAPANRESLRLMYRNLLNTYGEVTQYRDIDDTNALANLDMPVLMVIGDNDTVFCLAVADYLKQSLPQTTLVRMPDVAHFPNLSKPNEVNALLLRWLNDTHK